MHIIGESARRFELLLVFTNFSSFLTKMIVPRLQHFCGFVAIEIGSMRICCGMKHHFRQLIPAMVTDLFEIKADYPLRTISFMASFHQNIELKGLIQSRNPLAI